MAKKYDSSAAYERLKLPRPRCVVKLLELNKKVSVILIARLLSILSSIMYFQQVQEIVTLMLDGADGLSRRMTTLTGPEEEVLPVLRTLDRRVITHPTTIIIFVQQKVPSEQGPICLFYFYFVRFSTFTVSKFREKYVS